MPTISQRRTIRFINPDKLVHQINNSLTHLSAPSATMVGFCAIIRRTLGHENFCGARSIIENKSTGEAEAHSWHRSPEARILARRTMRLWNSPKGILLDDAL